MVNYADFGTAGDYHQATKLTYINLHHKPPLYKSYPDAPVVPLSGKGLELSFSTLDAVAGLAPKESSEVDLSALATFLYLSAGIVKKSRSPQAGEVHYRAAASAGALYPIETYAVCGDLPGVDAGVYYFSPVDYALQQLRSGDFRAQLAGAAAQDETIKTTPVTLVFTSIFRRSTWKYRARGYRYCLWDNGTMVANLLAAASALGQASQLFLGFIDEQVDRLVGVEGLEEASICLVSVGSPETSLSARDNPSLPDLSIGSPVDSIDCPDYPEVTRLHAATRLRNQAEVSQWRGELETKSEHRWESLYPVETPDPRELSPKSLNATIQDRGSTRRFDRSSISFQQFSALLSCSTKEVTADFLGAGSPSLLDLYFIVNGVDGLPSGAYFFSRQQPALELLKEGDFRSEAGHLCFEQALGADASAVAFLMTDLDRILLRYGDRGYRAAQLEAGLRGGKLYLCAYSRGLGASGITFYDDEITQFFSPHAQGKTPMFVVTLGKTAEQNRVRPFRSRVAVKLDALARGAGQV